MEGGVGGGARRRGGNASIDVTARRVKGTCHTRRRADHVENNGE